ncbi:hypothetical protein PHLCEN_2v1352 [Hermanssonia centrifuga]|uniref:PHD-type domain-containing protein n=1 Tax=Hermanssonia centrifuga TaxID=98765 RepID=A0A2R6S3F1_9APHY|nr:hypothetical protein PHLCEN_2v1352 [Hermanssonia centrifuga]
MPVVRPFPTPSAVSVAEVDTDGAAATGDGEADGDDTAYCYCQKSSYGEMIACDGKDCEREWFHLGCVGLAIIPSGAWYCDECRANKKTATKRAGRGGKRRAGGARARNTST